MLRGYAAAAAAASAAPLVPNPRIRDHAVFDPEAARRRQEARKKQIEEDPEQERERKDRQLLEVYTTLARECKAQCRRQPPATPGGPPPLQRDPGPRLAMEPKWRRNFIELNTVRLPVSEFSGTDIGFKAMCWSLRAEQPTHPDAEACCFFWIAELFFRTSVWSCQHTIEARTYWPTKKEFEAFRFRAAMVVTTYFEYGEGTDKQVSGKEGLIRALQDGSLLEPEPPEADDPKDSEMERLGKQLMRAEIDGARDIKARFHAMQVPPALQRVIDNRRAQIELIRRRKEKAGTANAADEDEKEEVADEFKGTQWRNTSVELVRFFVPRVARLVFKYDSDEELLLRFPPLPNPDVFTPAALTHFKEWIHTLALQGSRLSAVTQEFRSVFCDLALPVGSHTVPSRDVRTRYEKPLAYTRLKEEIGMDLASLYHDEMLNSFWPNLLRGPESELYWEASVLTLVNQEYRQRMNMTKENEWMKLYTVMHPDQNHQRDRLTSDTFLGYRGDDELRPVLMRCARKRWVKYRSRLIQCANIDEAILTMHRIVARDFRTQPANNVFRGFVQAARTEADRADATVTERVAHYCIEYERHNIRPICEVMLLPNATQ